MRCTAVHVRKLTELMHVSIVATPLPNARCAANYRPLVVCMGYKGMMREAERR